MHIQTWSNNNLNKHRTKRSSNIPVRCNAIVSPWQRDHQCAVVNTQTVTALCWRCKDFPTLEDLQQSLDTRQLERQRDRQASVKRVKSFCVKSCFCHTADMNSPRRFKASQPVSTRYRLPCQGQRTDTPSAKSSKSPPKSWIQAARTHKNMIYSLNLSSVGMQTVIQ